MSLDICLRLKSEETMDKYRPILKIYGLWAGRVGFIHTVATILGFPVQNRIAPFKRLGLDLREIANEPTLFCACSVASVCIDHSSIMDSEAETQRTLYVYFSTQMFAICAMFSYTKPWICLHFSPKVNFFFFFLFFFLFGGGVWFGVGTHM